MHQVAHQCRTDAAALVVRNGHDVLEEVMVGVREDGDGSARQPVNFDDVGDGASAMSLARSNRC